MHKYLRKEQKTSLNPRGLTPGITSGRGAYTPDSCPYILGVAYRVYCTIAPIRLIPPIAPV